MKAIYKFESDYGRMGTLYGLFIAECKDVNDLISSGDEINFGEVLGKHSEISGNIENKDIRMITDEPEIVDKVQALGMEIGFNPVEIWKEQKEGESD